MGGKPPLMVITDQDGAMANAIVKVIPEATHRLCSWHLVRKGRLTRVTEPLWPVSINRWKKIARKMSSMWSGISLLLHMSWRTRDG
ncbi:hypothetical protein LINGRAHAP2_LOCUS24392 [Linum grandiflorum]